MRLDGLGTSPLLASSSTHPASRSVRVPTVAGWPAASFSLSLAGSALQPSYSYHHRFCRVHFISIVQAHAGHTSARALACSSRRLAAKQTTHESCKTSCHPFHPVPMRSAGAPTAAREGACAPRIEFEFSGTLSARRPSRLVFAVSRPQALARISHIAIPVKHGIFSALWRSRACSLTFCSGQRERPSGELAVRTE